MSTRPSESKSVWSLKKMLQNQFTFSSIILMNFLSPDCIASANRVKLFNMATFPFAMCFTYTLFANQNQFICAKSPSIYYIDDSRGEVTQAYRQLNCIHSLPISYYIYRSAFWAIECNGPDAASHTPHMGLCKGKAAVTSSIHPLNRKQCNIGWIQIYLYQFIELYPFICSDNHI